MEAATLFQALVQVESNSLPQAPQRAVSRTYPAVPQRDEDVELRPLAAPSPAATPSGAYTPRDPGTSAPNTPGVVNQVDDPFNTFEVLPGLTDPPMNKYRFAGGCALIFLTGLVDSANGALLPYMEKHYNIGYAVVSLLFVGNALGFIIAAPFVNAIRMHLGRAKTLFLSNICIALGFIPSLVLAPFPAIVVGYFLIGLGTAWLLAIINAFTANMKNGTVLLGILHGSYGVGGIIGPLIATSIVTTMGPNAWNHYYLITISITTANAAFILWAFWNYEKETTAVETAPLTAPGPGLSAMLGAFQSPRIVLLGAIFIFAYQGAEVSISGWVISFFIAARGGNPSAVGNFTSGFWGGITLGRFALSPVGARIGEKRFVYLLTLGAAVFQLLVWLVPNLIGEAVSLAIVGLLLGPVYPCAAVVFTRSLSRQEHVSGLGVISAFGSSGGAVWPLATGLLSQAAGTFVLHPIAIGLFGGMLVCWYILPTSRKRTE
ncbi:major facilitator superfamily transporter [Xylaria venustula]|nr:major facilitator superfamily transporter [Xylaria venustula]